MRKEMVDKMRGQTFMTVKQHFDDMVSYRSQLRAALEGEPQIGRFSQVVPQPRLSGQLLMQPNRK